MRKLHAFFAFSCLALSACGSGGSDAIDQPVNPVPDARVFPPDEEVLAKLYDSTYRVPQDFFADERTATPRSYSLYHVKDFSLSYELCTDDYNEALTWETADNDGRAVHGEYVGSYENDKYYEIIRELSYPDSFGNIPEPTSPGYARIFKCSYVNRDGVDRNLRDGYAGTLNQGRLSEDVIRIFSEYMWQYTFFWPARKKVLETSSSPGKNSFKHTLLLAFASSQGTDRCDLIEVVDWVFTVDKSTGQISKDFSLLYQFEARLVDGIAEKCAS